MTAQAFQNIFLPLMGAGGLTALIVAGVAFAARRDGRRK
jgi:hypothetical protein